MAVQFNFPISAAEEPVVAGQVLATVRVFRTTEGVLVEAGDPRAAFLAYPIGEPVTPADLDAYQALVAPSAPSVKMAARPADKAAAKPANK